MENKLDELIKESQHMAKVSDRILDLANQLLELTATENKYPIMTGPYSKSYIDYVNDFFGSPFPEASENFAREEFDEMTSLKVTHE